MEQTISSKISFLSGFALTSMWSMTIYEISMAFILGLVGGLGGVFGRWIWKKIWK